MSDQWKRLQDATTSMDVSQITWIMSREPVKEAYSNMMQTFSTYLFERFKDDFAGCPAFEGVINTYISSVIKAAEEFAKHTENLEKENEELRRQLQEYQKNDERSETRRTE